MNLSRICGSCVFGIVVACWAGAQAANEPVLIPAFDGDFWTVSGDPDLGEWTSEKQQPVDFGVWQAQDGTWGMEPGNSGPASATPNVGGARDCSTAGKARGLPIRTGDRWASP